VFVIMTFHLPFLHVHNFFIVPLPDTGAVKFQKAPLKSTYIEQMKKSSWPKSKSYCYYGIQ